MVKIQKNSSIEPTLGFTEFDIFQKYRHSFACSELGGLYGVLPLSELARSIGLKDTCLGRRSYFLSEGRLALMFPKPTPTFPISNWSNI